MKVAKAAYLSNQLKPREVLKTVQKQPWLCQALRSRYEDISIPCINQEGKWNSTVKKKAERWDV